MIPRPLSVREGVVRSSRLTAARALFAAADPPDPAKRRPPPDPDEDGKLGV